MAARIILLGREEKQFLFIQNALKTYSYQFEFHSFEGALPPLDEPDLVILDTLPLPETRYPDLMAALQPVL
ncbi:MAG TPA: hypothetical protein PKV71_21630, partial [Calditrichia bacterium]|nr:hypothetical protein [Calditrichia bacterium]